MQKFVIRMFSQNLLHSLRDMITTGIFVWNIQKRVSQGGKTNAQCEKSPINRDAGDPILTVSADYVPSKVHPAESETLVLDSIGEEITNTSEPMKVSDNTLSEKIA